MRAVAEYSTAGVFRVDGFDSSGFDFGGVSDFEFGDVSEADFVKEWSEVGGSDDRGGGIKLFEGGDVEMIPMGVGDKNGVDVSCVLI